MLDLFITSAFLALTVEPSQSMWLIEYEAVTRDRSHRPHILYEDM
jgi:hypothetical protein